MTTVLVRVIPVSFAIAASPARLVALSAYDHDTLTRRAGPDPEAAARQLLDDAFAGIGRTFGLRPGDDALTANVSDVRLAGVAPRDGGITLVYTAAVPTPFAEKELDVTVGSPFSWRTLRKTSGKRVKGADPDHVEGDDALVLDYWRQAFEETDAALDFLPDHLTLLQLRSLYDALWGYDQDASGFKRWAVDRTGAFARLLDEVPATDDLDGLFYEALGKRLSPSRAAAAGALTRGSLSDIPADGTGLALASAAATTVNRLWSRPGPEPQWYRKSKKWRAGPHWISNVYPPRPSWTTWELP